MESESKLSKIKRMGFKTKMVGSRVIAETEVKYYEGSVTEVYSKIMENTHPYVEGKYYALGEAFSYKGQLAEAAMIDEDGFDHGQGCERCVLNDGYCKHDKKTFNEKILCVSAYRKDKKSVFFRLISSNIMKREDKKKEDEKA